MSRYWPGGSASRPGANLKASKRNATPPVSGRGLSMMGLVGWSVVLPTVLGTALGVWLDRHYPMSHSWTLTLLFAGLFVGCLNAWYWIAKEDKDTHRTGESHNG